MKTNPLLSKKAIFGMVFALLVVLAIVANWRTETGGIADSRIVEPASKHVDSDKSATIQAAAPSPSSAKTVEPGSDQTFSWFSKRPFAAAKESKTHEWTAEDGLSPDFIFKVAHNDLEAQRMLEENDQIKGRQLVYRKETVPSLLEQAQAGGQPLKSFTLPGLNGQEIEVEVTEVNARSMQAGSVSGRVKGRFNSMVSVGFSNGCESYNVISPDDGMYLAADAREPGEVVVKEIDPAKYKVHPQTGVPDFILTNQPVSGQKASPTPSK